MNDRADRHVHDVDDGTDQPDVDIEAAIDALFDGERLGSLMMQQLAELIESWTKVLEALAENGVDPTPMLQTLARTLRATADQLDPEQ